MKTDRITRILEAAAPATDTEQQAQSERVGQYAIQSIVMCALKI